MTKKSINNRFFNCWCEMPNEKQVSHRFSSSHVYVPLTCRMPSGCQEWLSLERRRFKILMTSFKCCMSERRVPWTWAVGSVKGNSLIAQARCHAPAPWHTKHFSAKITNRRFHKNSLPSWFAPNNVGFSGSHQSCEAENVHSHCKYISQALYLHIKINHKQIRVCMHVSVMLIDLCGCQFLSDRSYQAAVGWCDMTRSVYSIFQMKALRTSSYINMHQPCSLSCSLPLYSPANSSHRLPPSCHTTPTRRPTGC